MKKYKVIQIRSRAEDTEYELNKLAKEGWKLICSYVAGTWLIMEAEDATN